MKKKVLSVFGTRPEAIKMCPIILEIQQSRELAPIVCVTGQHQEMLKQVLGVFDIKPDFDLGIMRPRQNITSITTDVLIGMETVLKQVRPDVVLVHGDTTTSMAAALSAFYAQIPVGHVEAGLRTHNKYLPFPEEMNRTLTSRIAEYHFAPTEHNRLDLANEGITRNVYVTGNTVIDVFKTTIVPGYHFKNEALNNIDYSRKVVLMTAHRRENIGKPIENICNAVLRLCRENPDVLVVYPIHLNPEVREIAEPILKPCTQVVLIDPLDVMDLHNLMSRCYIVLTDSGGLQEEAPHFGKPVLVLRTETERPEAVDAGTARVVGVNEQDIFDAAQELLTSSDTYKKMSCAINPYGDGHASSRIRGILEKEIALKKFD